MVTWQGVGECSSIPGSQSGVVGALTCALQSPTAQGAHRACWEASRRALNLQALTNAGSLHGPPTKGQTCLLFSTNLSLAT